MSAGSALGYLFAIGLTGVLWSVQGWEIDKINFMFNGLSQDASNMITYLCAGFALLPIILITLYTLAHWINEKTASSQQV
jgi:hypothetical protein